MSRGSIVAIACMYGLFAVMLALVSDVRINFTNSFERALKQFHQRMGGIK